MVYKFIVKSVNLFLFLFMLFLFSQLFFSSPPEIFAVVDPGSNTPMDTNDGSSQREITKDFDVRTTSTMTKEKFEAYVNKGGLFDDKFDLITTEAQKYGLNAGFMVAIMIHESTYGTSELIKDFYNPGGLTCASSSSGHTEAVNVSFDCKTHGGDILWKKFKNIDDAIKEKANYLDRKYFQEKKVYTIYDIQQIYCPDKDKGCEDWVPGVISAMTALGEGYSSILAKPGEGVIHGEVTEDDLMEYVSPFEDKKIDEDNFSGAGINTKKPASGAYQDYKLSGWMKFIVNSLRIITMVASILVFGYVSLIWMLILLARTHMAPVHDFLNKISLGAVDPYNDLGKMIKITLIILVIISIGASGLMPLVFIFIYQTIIDVINYIF